MKIRVKPTTGDPTPDQIAAANLFAKQFAARRGLMNPEDVNVGNKVPPFVDAATGKDITGQPATKSNVKLSTYVPPEVTELKEDETGYPYYEHPQTGEPVHVPQTYRYLPRFNPKAGTYNQSIAKK